MKLFLLITGTLIISGSIYAGFYSDSTTQGFYWGGSSAPQKSGAEKKSRGKVKTVEEKAKTAPELKDVNAEAMPVAQLVQMYSNALFTFQTNQSPENARNFILVNKMLSTKYNAMWKSLREEYARNFDNGPGTSSLIDQISPEDDKKMSVMREASQRLFVVAFLDMTTDQTKALSRFAGNFVWANFRNTGIPYQLIYRSNSDKYDLSTNTIYTEAIREFSDPDGSRANIFNVTAYPTVVIMDSQTGAYTIGMIKAVSYDVFQDIVIRFYSDMKSGNTTPYKNIKYGQK